VAGVGANGAGEAGGDAKARRARNTPRENRRMRCATGERSTPSCYANACAACVRRPVSRRVGWWIEPSWLV